MTPEPSLILQLAKENKKLRENLSIAEQWIGREMSDTRLRRTKEKARNETKNDLYESESDIESRIQKYFGEGYAHLAEEDRQLLRDSEINFSHLIRQKKLDGMMVSSAYQKILENIFETHITTHFRQKYKKTRLHPTNNILEKTLYKVIHDDFRLSLGKLFQIFEAVTKNTGADLMNAFRESIEDKPLYRVFDDGEFWELFSDLIDTQAFGGKRHTGKISFTDIQLLREIMTGHFQKNGFLKLLLKYLVNADTQQGENE